ncbi:MAG: hypothetical protein ACOYLF_01030 [Blastocatellia bacterium]
MNVRYLFFQGRFCARCGNEIDGRSWWRTRYLCDRCEPLPGRRAILVAIVLCVAAGFVLARKYPPPAIRPPRAVSALDATPRPCPEFDFEDKDEERVLCGAITRRGTPCRRLVRPGELCSQHQRQSPTWPGRTGKSPAPNTLPVIPP